jgi:hypothetical protein
MKKKIFFGAFAASIILFACTKDLNSTDNANLETVSSQKQILSVDFGTEAYAQQSGVAKSGAGITGLQQGGFVESKPININVLKEAAPFITLYGTVDGNNVNDQDVTFEFASSAGGSTWSSWQALHKNVDASEDLGKYVFSGTDLEANATKVKFKVTFNNTNSSLSKAKIYIFNPLFLSAAEQANIDAKAAEIKAEMDAYNNEPGARATAGNPALCAKPSFTSRSTWGARAPRSQSGTTTVNFLVVHHEEGSNTSSNWAARVKAIQNLHMDVNGWADIGYNYLVDPNGVPYEGRAGGENITGAHLCGKNGNTMGVCMLGSFTSVSPTNNALYALKRIIAWKAKQRGINVTQTGYHVDRTIHKFSGHRASCSTDCPGTTLFNTLGTLRTDIQNNFINQCF